MLQLNPLLKLFSWITMFTYEFELVRKVWRVQSSQGRLSHLFMILHFREHWKSIQLESIPDFQGMLFLSHGNEDSHRGIEDGRVL